MSQQRQEARVVALRALQGKAPPESVTFGWSRFLRLPEAAVRSFWELLGPMLVDPSDGDHEHRLRAFAREHALAEKDLIAALHACVFLLNRASAVDLSVDAFREDIETLSSRDGESDDSPPGPANVLLSRYEQVKAEIRRAIVRGTLADHGKVLVGLDWRLDTMAASDRGVQLSSPVIFLTLRYQEGTRVDRTTLQLSPDGLQELKRFCDQFAG